MATTSLEQILHAEESNTLEFKVSPNRSDSIGAVVCGFLNGEGGTLVIGVDERRSGADRVVGVKAADVEGERLRRHLLERISPEAVWSLNVEQVDGKSLIVIDVPAGADKPYVYDDRIFIRRGGASRAAHRDEISNLVSRKSGGAEWWERLPALGVDISDLDAQEILLTADLARKTNRFRLDSSNSPMGVLEALNLASRGSIYNGAVVLFGKNPAALFPQTRVRAIRFKGKGVTEFADNRSFEGNAFSLVTQIEAFLNTHNPISGALPKSGLTRTDESAYPPAALREAILNAVVHRDYSMFDGGISISVFNDRLEIWNSGDLPSGFTVETLKAPHPSRPHNPDIANVFFLRGFIERFGIGTRQIVETCREAGLPDPEWTVVGGGVTLTIRLKAGGSVRSAAPDLNPRQIELLQRLKVGENLLPHDYYESVKEQVQPRQARNDLTQLTKLGYLKRVGSGRSLVYTRSNKPLE